MRSIMQSVSVGGVWYRHEIDTETDATHFIDEDTDGEVLRIDRSADVYVHPFTEQFGRFRMETGDFWSFLFEDESKGKIETNHRDLIKAELVVFKKLINDNQLIIPEGEVDGHAS